MISSKEVSSTSTQASQRKQIKDWHTILTSTGELSRTLDQLHD